MNHTRNNLFFLISIKYIFYKSHVSINIFYNIQYNYLIPSNPTALLRCHRLCKTNTHKVNVFHTSFCYLQFFYIKFNCRLMKVQGPKIQLMYLIQYLRVFCKLFLLHVFLFIYILQIISKQSVQELLHLLPGI